MATSSWKTQGDPFGKNVTAGTDATTDTSEDDGATKGVTTGSTTGINLPGFGNGTSTTSTGTDGAEVATSEDAASSEDTSDEEVNYWSGYNRTAKNATAATAPETATGTSAETSLNKPIQQLLTSSGQQETSTPVQGVASMFGWTADSGEKPLQFIKSKVSSAGGNANAPFKSLLKQYRQSGGSLG